MIDEIAPLPTDYMIWKRGWSPFFQTRFELSLRSRGVDTIILNGGSVEIGIAATVYAMQSLDFDTVIVSDGCTSERAACSDALMQQVFPIIGRDPDHRSGAPDVGSRGHDRLKHGVPGASAWAESHYWE